MVSVVVTPAGPSVPIVDGAEPAVNVHAVGARGQGGDDTAALAEALGGRYANVFIPAGVYGVTRPIQVGSGVSVNGVGEQSVIKALASFSGEHVIGVDRQSGARGSRYQLCGRFKVDGSGVADIGLYVGLCVYSRFELIYVTGCALGMVVDAAQNCSFSDFDIAFNTAGLKVLNGAGNNLFSRVEVSDCGAASAGEASHLTIANDASYPNYSMRGAGAFDDPTSNTFLRCIFERSTEATHPTRARIKAGRQNHFLDCDWATDNQLALVVDSGVDLTRVTNFYMGGPNSGTTSYAISNAGFNTVLDGGLIENFGASNVIRTSNRLNWRDLSFSDTGAYIQNTGGNSRAQLRQTGAAQYIGASGQPIAASHLYPGLFSFNDQNELFVYLNGVVKKVTVTDP